MRCALSCIRAATLLPDMSGALIALQLLLVSIKNSNIDDNKFIRQCLNANVEYLRISN